MNAAWAREWAANFANPDKLMDMYADDAQFEDVIIAHKESGKAEVKKFFVAAGNPAYAENTFTAVGYSGNADGGAVERPGKRSTLRARSSACRQKARRRIQEGSLF